MSDFWVFGYGSLIWNPGFDHLERKRARLHGLHRSLCIYSWVHRGTQAKPGLVLGLDKGGSCHGVAMRASHEKKETIVDYLRARELVTAVYLECWRKVTLESGETVMALVYRVDQTSPQYADGLSLDSQTEIVRTAVGGSGHNIDYVQSTVAAMKREGIRDHSLEYIDRKLRSKAQAD
ncbi:MAG: gamma-glutamylcyclotransferase [Pseudomonadota bacterium]